MNEQHLRPAFERLGVGGSADFRLRSGGLFSLERLRIKQLFLYMKILRWYSATEPD
jgi:hypothetical protein